MVGGRNTVIVDNDKCITYQEEHPDKQVFTKIEWKSTAVEVAYWLFNGCLSQLMERSEVGDGSDVRLVFWLW
jgi:hypothetical protein